MKNIILIVVLQTFLVAGIGAGGWFMGKGSCNCAGEEGAAEGGDGGEEGAAAESGKDKPDPIYKELESLVLNMRDGDRLRFMQVQFTIKTYDDDVVAAIEKYDPRIRGEMISLFSGFSVSDISTTEGKEIFQKDAIAKLNEILADEAGIKGGVAAIYFTKLVIQ